MNNYLNVIISLISILFCTQLELCVYKLISTNQIIVKNKIPVLFISILEFLIFIYIDSSTRLILSFLILFLLYQMIFKEKVKLALVKTLIIFLIMVCFELFFSIIMVNVPFLNIDKLNFEILNIKNLFSILIMLFTLLFFSINDIKKFTKKIIQILYNKEFNLTYIFLITVIVFTGFLLMAFEERISKYNYFSNLLFTILVLLFVYLIMNNKIKILKVEEKQRVLLEYLTSYEKIIDKSRINQHEILNNLLILKSFKNKNSKEFSDTLNEVIYEYGKIKYENVKNIDKLPTGIKGILYYKINNIKKSGIKLNFYYSTDLEKIWPKINNKSYIALCKMFGIFIDNSIEAAKESNKKIIVVDIYLIKNELNIYIENSTKGNVDIEKMKEKNMSTKGKSRGLGLYIAYNLQRNNNKIKIKQYNKNNNFVTEMSIKVK